MLDFLPSRLSTDSRRSLWAVADQCAVSGGNFLTNLILLRTLVPVEYGTYALILNAMLFCNNINQAFVAYPLCVRGARANPRQFRRILAFALFATLFLLLIFLGPALAVIGVSLHRSAVVFAAVAAMLLWQLQDTVRSGFIAKLEQKRALLGDTISYAGQAAILGLLSLRIAPGLEIIFWTIAGTSLVAFAVQVWQTRPAVPPERTLRPLVHEFWSLGRWSVVAKLLGFLTLQAFPWVILTREGRLGVAAYQALFLFLAFTNPLLFSIGSLITATVAKDREYWTQSVRSYLLLVGGLVGAYLLLLVVAGPPVMKLLYGSHSVYLPYAHLLRIFAAAWAFEVIALLTAAILGGLRDARALFLIQLGGAAAAVLIALPWIYWKGLVVAGFAMLLVNAVRAATGILLLVLRRSAGVGGPGLYAEDSARLVPQGGAASGDLVEAGFVEQD